MLRKNWCLSIIKGYGSSLNPSICEQYDQFGFKLRPSKSIDPTTTKIPKSEKYHQYQMTCYLRVTSNANGCRGNLVNLHRLRVVDYVMKTSKKDPGVGDVEKWNLMMKRTNGGSCIIVKVVLPSCFHLCFAHFSMLFSPQHTCF